MKKSNYRTRSYERSYQKRRQVSRLSKLQAYRPLLALLLIIGVWYTLIGKDLLPLLGSKANDGMVEEKRIVYETPCMQANLAKFISYVFEEESANEENKKLKEQEEQKADRDLGEIQWYTPYYQELQAKGITSLKEEDASELLSYEILNEVLSESLGENIAIKSSDMREEQNYLSLQEVIKYIESILKQKQQKEINYIELVILATPTEGEGLGAWQVITSKGKFNFEGLILEPLKGKTLQVATRGDELIGVMEIVKNTGQIDECKIKEVSDNEVKLEVDGISFNLNNTNGIINKMQEGSIGKISLQDDEITGYELLHYGEQDTVVRVTENTITLEKAGTLTYKDVIVEDCTDLGSYTALKQLPYGTQVAYQKEGSQLMAVQVLTRASGEGLRVILSNGQGSYTHEKVELKSLAGYQQIYNDETITLEANTLWDSESFKWQEGVNTIRFVPQSDSLMEVLTLEKREGSPAYKGTLEITKTDGGYTLINELDIENYVAGVIPSEMPTSYGLEALKVQAVAARTYALASKGSSKFMSYGAHVDDTTASQVYNNIKPNTLAYEAAAATAGEVLSYEGNLLSSKFFATSCGYTANYGEVWASGETFPTQTPSYMTYAKQYTGDALVSDMTDEKEAYEFFTLGEEDLDAFDEASPWFRWQVTLTQKELGNLIKPALGKLSKQYPHVIKVLRDENWVEEAIEDIGYISDIQVLERGKGGNIMTLRIDGSKASVKVSTEYMIRNLFASNDEQGLTVVRSDDSVVSQMSLLPSAFFAPEITYDEDQDLKQLVLYGGGFGHGVGMSQDGVRGMANLGYDYKAILSHYYKGVDLINWSKSKN